MKSIMGQHFFVYMIMEQDQPSLLISLPAYNIEVGK